MHVPNHLVSPEAAILGGAAAIALLVVAITKINKNNSLKEKLPLAGVMGTFVFAAQMLNFAIGNTGFSGHLIGGILLAAVLGRWLGFVTLSGVITLQALLFADGGIMALGWNIINMAAISTLVAYPLIFLPLVRNNHSPMRMALAAMLASIVAVEGGAFALSLQTWASGITSLPTGEFMSSMLAVHLAIGVAEGLISALIVGLIASREAAMLDANTVGAKALRINYRRAIVAFAVAALIVGGALTLMASERPDGLEWSIIQAGGEAVEIAASQAQQTADALQQNIAIAPDYEGDYTGLLATAGMLLLIWLGSGVASYKTDTK